MAAPWWARILPLYPAMRHSRGRMVRPVLDRARPALSLEPLEDRFLLSAVLFNSNDTIGSAAALSTSSPTDGLTHSSTDVALYSIQMESGDQIALHVASPDPSNPIALFQSFLRVFDGQGNQLAAAGPDGLGTTDLQFTAPQNATYYVGVSNASNSGYNPLQPPSNSGTETGGTFLLSLQYTAAPSPTDSSSSSASSGGGNGNGPLAHLRDMLDDPGDAAALASHLGPNVAALLPTRDLAPIAGESGPSPGLVIPGNTYLLVAGLSGSAAGPVAVPAGSAQSAGLDPAVGGVLALSVTSPSSAATAARGPLVPVLSGRGLPGVLALAPADPAGEPGGSAEQSGAQAPLTAAPHPGLFLPGPAPLAPAESGQAFTPDPAQHLFMMGLPGPQPPPAPPPPGPVRPEPAPVPLTLNEPETLALPGEDEQPNLAALDALFISAMPAEDLATEAPAGRRAAFVRLAGLVAAGAFAAFLQVSLAPGTSGDGPAGGEALRRAACEPPRRERR
jgi:hypothetical protein